MTANSHLLFKNIPQKDPFYFSIWPPTKANSELETFPSAFWEATAGTACSVSVGQWKWDNKSHLEMHQKNDFWGKRKWTGDQICLFTQEPLTPV